MTFSLTRGRPQRSAAGRFAVPLILPILALILSLFTGLSGVLRRQLETAADFKDALRTAMRISCTATKSLA